MPDFKEVAEYLGLKPDEIKTMDDFKSFFDKDFIKQSSITEESEPVKKIIGRKFGLLENEVKRIAKSHELEIDFDSEDLKDKKVTDKMKFVFSEYEKKYKSTVDDLTAKAGLGNDEKVKEWEKKYEKLQGKKTEIETLLNSTKNEYDTFRIQKEGEIKNTKLNVHKKELYGRAKFSSDENKDRFELTKKGFFTTFEDKYSIDLDENESPFIIDKNTNQKIVSTKVAGTFKTVDEVIEEELVKANLLQLNKDAGKSKPASQFQPSNNSESNKNKRTIAPRM